MKLYRTTSGIVIENNDRYYKSSLSDWDEYVNRDNLHAFMEAEIKRIKMEVPPAEFSEMTILAPIHSQELWASGVTYLRSKTARMEESKESGGDTFYDKVYDAERPELFFKALAHRVAPPGGKVRIRKDSTWDVPEPELTLFITSNQKIVGYTIGNDMSSRSIEGENPLYLPQAKSYDGSAALGPCLYIPGEPIPADTWIHLSIKRERKEIFSEKISIRQMKRKHTELVDFLFRETTFHPGVFLMTGTGIVPPHPFTLKIGDEVRITIDNIGELINIVE
jgi:2-dehydro-3-deoxy-D-arabinonate dehydratase